MFQIRDQINLIVALNCFASGEAKTELLLENNYVNFLANDTSVIIKNLPKYCNYTVGYIKLYKYQNEAATKNYHYKNISICNEGTFITIPYD